eukprot:227902-Alexandrium_andersonii.AAC.1
MRCAREGNQAMLAVAKSGCNPTMRYLRRARGLSVQRLLKQLGPAVASAAIRLEDAADMHADIYTKMFDDVSKWNH